MSQRNLDNDIPDHWLAQYLNNAKKADMNQDAARNCSLARTIMRLTHNEVMGLANNRGLT